MLGRFAPTELLLWVAAEFSFRTLLQEISLFNAADSGDRRRSKGPEINESAI